ncbi:hypothetical protein HXX76_012521 [Chlamydomonas incerta]|uniref:Uncharacterized protein n=1 Tax=Chlamydomonas incerta TaxID=51695 RepID=A0A835SWU1_CHLIN|nr:hypothetical protein HXX76_012521 [Chlamydomonas incerta]|eukprot:KAG2427326.1 hypothetical protein HXX76_012521 [Chlamydomonas incerta]
MARNVWDCALVKPATAEAKCRYVDLVPAEHVGHSTYFISHRWGCNFRAELVAVLEQRFGAPATAAAAAATAAAAPAAAPAPHGQHGPPGGQSAPAAPLSAAAAGQPGQTPASGGGPGVAGIATPAPRPDAGPGTPEAAAAAAASSPPPPPVPPPTAVFLWLDIFAVNQHPDTTQADDLANLQNVIRHSQATVMLLDAQGAVLTRIWCLYEAWKTAEFKGAGGLQVLAPPTAVNYSALEGVFVRLDVRAAEATVEADRVRILAEVECSMGAAALNVYIKGALVDSAILESNAALPAASAIAAPILEALSALRQRQREHQAAVEAAAAAALGSSEADGAGGGGGGGAAAPVGTVAAAAAPPPPLPPPEPMLLSPADGTTLLRGAAACFRAARMLQFVANLRGAETLIREALALFTAAEGGGGGAHSLACLQALANILMPMKGRLDEAQAVLQTTLTLSAQVHGPRHHLTAAILNDLGLLAFWREDWAEAEAYLKTALVIYGERRAAMPPAEHTEAVLAGTLSLGVVVGKQGPHRADEAEAALRSALDGYSRRAGGRPDQGLAEARAHLGKLEEARGRHGEAEAHYAQAVALSRQIFGAQHPAVADALAGVARQMAATGRLRDAAQLSRAAHATALAALGPGGSGLVDRLAAQLADHEARLAAAVMVAAGEQGQGPVAAQAPAVAPSPAAAQVPAAAPSPAAAQGPAAAAAAAQSVSVAEGCGVETAAQEGVGVDSVPAALGASRAAAAAPRPAGDGAPPALGPMAAAAVAGGLPTGAPTSDAAGEADGDGAAGAARLVAAAVRLVVAVVPTRGARRVE